MNKSCEKKNSEIQMKEEKMKNQGSINPQSQINLNNYQRQSYQVQTNLLKQLDEEKAKTQQLVKISRRKN